VSAAKVDAMAGTKRVTERKSVCLALAVGITLKTGSGTVGHASRTLHFDRSDRSHLSTATTNAAELSVELGRPGQDLDVPSVPCTRMRCPSSKPRIAAKGGVQLSSGDHSRGFGDRRSSVRRERRVGKRGRCISVEYQHFPA
jgi:hypothetical protein